MERGLKAGVGGCIPSNHHRSVSGVLDIHSSAISHFGFEQIRSLYQVANSPVAIIYGREGTVSIEDIVGHRPYIRPPVIARRLHYSGSQQSDKGSVLT